MLIREYVSLTLFLCVVLAVYIKEASLILKLIFHKLGRRQGPSGFLSKPAVAVHIVSFIGILCILYAMFIEPQWIEVKRVGLTTPKLSKAHIRIVQISDTHCDPEDGREMKAVAIINSLKPDVVVFTGDALNTEKAMPVFKAAMKAIDAPWKFAVTGNFDYWFMRGKDLFGGTGFKALDRETVKLVKDGEPVYITGLDFGGWRRWPEALSRVPRDKYSVFLYHKPDLVEDMKGKANVDLYLCGHTHGGQIALPVYGAIITFAKYGKRYEAGEYKVGDTVLYVNRGLGLEGKAPIKARFFARPEITVFDIKPEIGRRP